jgi:hypothetical protein
VPQVPDTKVHDWQLLMTCMEGLMRNKTWPYISKDEALQLIPFAHKVR